MISTQNCTSGFCSASIWKSCFLYTPHPSSVRMWVFWGQEPSSIPTYRAKFLAKELVKCGVNCCLVVQSCLTLCNPMDCSALGFSIHGISQARVGKISQVLEWVAISFSRGSSWPRDRIAIYGISKWILYRWANREAHGVNYHFLNKSF